MEQILLYYKYVDIMYPKQVLKWQKKICAELNLKGRILLATEGINGTVCGSIKNTEKYIDIMNKSELFKDIDFKTSPGSPDAFPRMQVTVKNEIVNLGLDTKEVTPQDGGKHLTPDEVHQLLENKPEDLVVLDTRNDYEWKVGTFRNAVKPPIKNFREFPEYIEKNLDTFKDKKVLMFCTGGVRCERATTVLTQKNVAKDVYQIEGGIHRYVEKYPDGHFRGKNYVFDNRVAVRVNDDVLGSCYLCATPCDEYINCFNVECNKHVIACDPCVQKYENTCSAQCQELINTQQVNKRPARPKINLSEEACKAKTDSCSV